MIEQELIERCKRQDRNAQKTLWDKCSPTMMGVCRRYLNTQEDAEDVLLEGFYKIFDKIDSYKGEGSFEGWMRRVMVNEALMFLRKKHNFNLTVEFTGIEIPYTPDYEEDLSPSNLLSLLERLPTGYRTVFNMFVMEDFKHREIAEILGISINTSKSQLILAKEKLKQLLLERNQTDVI